MLNGNCRSGEPIGGLAYGFAGQLDLLRREYTRRSAEIAELLEHLEAGAPGLAGAAQWREALAESSGAFLAGVELCADAAAHMERAADEGRLRLDNDRVVAEVASGEAAILQRLTQLQRISSASLRAVFDLGLPARIGSLGPGGGELLRAAINRQTDLTQLVSNGLQDLAILLKERDKLVTHPLDEDHPE